MMGLRSESRGVRGVPPRSYFSPIGAQLGGPIYHLIEEKEKCGGTPPTPPDLLRRPVNDMSYDKK